MHFTLFVICSYASIKSFLQREDLEELGTIEMVVIGIYGKFAKTFILVLASGLEATNTQALVLFLEFYVQHV
jgi:hypothetical protein